MLFQILDNLNWPTLTENATATKLIKWFLASLDINQM